MALPSLFAGSAHPSMLVFIIFYGLDWVATVPPTIALCRQHFGDSGSIVFGWVFASHQIGAAFAATAAAVVRDHYGAYDFAFYAAGMLCLCRGGVLDAGTRTGHARPAVREVPGQQRRSPPRSAGGVG